MNVKAFVITLPDDEYSKRVTERCIASAEKHGVKVDPYIGTDKAHADEMMKILNLKWTWANNNRTLTWCPNTKLRQHPYKGANLSAKKGCFISHYRLWNLCMNSGHLFLILEHDSIFLRPLPEINFNGICQINDPKGATRRGKWWSEQMVKRGTTGVHEKTWVTTNKDRHIPDGLAGNSAYLIRPWAAEMLIDKTKELGVWPNDAIMCKQLFPFLEEYYPFITRVEQEVSTSSDFKK